MTSRWIVMAACVAIAAPAHADSPDKIAVDTAQDLLAGRLVAKLPKAMRVEVSSERETRAIYDLDSTRFVMKTTEAFATTGAELKAQVATQGGKAAALEPIALAKPLVAYAVTGPDAKASDASLLLSMWIGNSDGTVQVVAFYISKDGAKDAAAWTVLARKIAATVAPGKRALAFAAGERKLDTLTVTLPARWAVRTQLGPGYSMFYLTPMAPLGTTLDSRCVVHLGEAPSYQHVDAGIDAKRVHERAGKLRGAAASWHDWNRDGLATTEAMTPYNGGTLYVLCEAKTDGELATLRTMMETLK